MGVVEAVVVGVVEAVVVGAVVVVVVGAVVVDVVVVVTGGGPWDTSRLMGVAGLAGVPAPGWLVMTFPAGTVVEYSLMVFPMEKPACPRMFAAVETVSKETSGT